MSLSLTGAVLGLRGGLTPQPMHLTKQGVDGAQETLGYLCWNGEVFWSDPAVDRGTNDTAVIASRLQPALLEGDPAAALQRVRSALRGIWGPFAFVLVDVVRARVFFGRDAQGRRSLLWHSSERQVSIGSVAEVGDEELAEVPPEGVFMLCFGCGVPVAGFETSLLHVLALQSSKPAGEGTPQQDLARCEMSLSMAPWSCKPSSTEATATDVTATRCPAETDAWPVVQLTMEPGSLHLATTPQTKAALHLLARLALAVQRRVTDCAESGDASPPQLLPLQPGDPPACGVPVASSVLPSHAAGDVAGPARVGVLFSGGIDCMVLAALAHTMLPPGEPIDLINVTFSQSPVQAGEAISGLTSPDRTAALAGYQELLHACPGRPWRFIAVDEDLSTLQAVQERVMTLCTPRNSTMDFSIAAALWCAARGIGWTAASGAQVGTRTEHPATAAVQAALAFCAAGPTHVWGPAALPHDVSLEDGSVPEQATAAAATGHTPVPEQAAPATAAAAPAPPEPSTAPSTSAVVDGEEHTLVRSAARVLLLGMGADEQCGGYGRHHTAFARGREEVKGSGERGPPGWAALQGELDMDTARIWQRNLGRDDRIVSDHGREARFPFLDEGVTGLLRCLPLPCVSEPRLPRGEGDKRIIRLVGQALGLGAATGLVKRAIQFGSRVARVTNKAVVAARVAAEQGEAAAQQVTGRGAMNATRGTDAFQGL